MQFLVPTPLSFTGYNFSSVGYDLKSAKGNNLELDFVASPIDDKLLFKGSEGQHDN